MNRTACIALIALVCTALPGCSVRMHGNQSVSGGTATATTSSQVSGSTSFSGGKASFSSGGQPVSPGAPGGHVAASGSAAAVVVGIVMLADLLNYFRGEPQPRPLPAGTKIMDTCSCYQKPVNSEW